MEHTKGFFFPPFQGPKRLCFLWKGISVQSLQWQSYLHPCPTSRMHRCPRTTTWAVLYVARYSVSLCNCLRQTVGSVSLISLTSKRGWGGEALSPLYQFTYFLNFKWGQVSYRLALGTQGYVRRGWWSVHLWLRRHRLHWSLSQLPQLFIIYLSCSYSSVGWVHFLYFYFFSI